MTDSSEIYLRTSKILNTLSQSPMFHLSMASIELFHSNFLHWLIGRYGYDIVVRLFGEKLVGAMEVQVRSSREKSNIDLTIEVGNNTKIYIENKFKSWPDQKQLLKYRQKLIRNDGKGQYFVLLCLGLPESGGSSASTDWQTISYADVATALERAINDGVIDAGYQRELVRDYTEYIRSISRLIRLFIPLWKSTNNILEYGENSLRDLMAHHRMHDMYDKHRFGFLAENIRHMVSSDRHLMREYQGSVSVDVGFTRGTGIVDVWIQQTSESKNSLVIQIQADSLKLMVNCPHNRGEELDSILDRLDSVGWFSFEGVQHRGKVYPKSGGFNKYDDIMRYKRVRLMPLGLGQLVETVRKLIHRGLEYSVYLGGAK